VHLMHRRAQHRTAVRELVDNPVPAQPHSSSCRSLEQMIGQPPGRLDRVDGQDGALTPATAPRR
ncbi:hypothetical protein ACW9HQ_48455, partial [Nocardia gipuzkoensis]